MDPYSTHLPYLERAIKTLGGPAGEPVLELGGGNFSTSLIKSLCPNSITIETNPQWAQALINKFGPSVIYLSDYQNQMDQYFNKQWNIVFNDMEYCEQRVWCATRFTNMHLLICHDTENDYWNPIYPHFKFIKHFKELTPNTSYLSNTIDVNTI